MRDSHILAGLNEIQYKAGHDIQLLAQEVRLVRFRQEAVEEVLFGSPIRSLYVALLMVFSPASIKRMIDDVQVRIHNDFMAAMERERIERTKKAKSLTLPKGVGVIPA